MSVARPTHTVTVILKNERERLSQNAPSGKPLARSRITSSSGKSTVVLLGCCAQTMLQTLLSRYFRGPACIAPSHGEAEDRMVTFIRAALFMALGLGFAMAQTPATSPPGTAWLELRQGVKAYTGDDGGGAKTLTVCTSAYFYKKWFSSSAAVIPECTEKPRGIPVRLPLIKYLCQIIQI